MPQMMPLSWIILFIFFLLTFMSFNMMNYFINLPKINKMKNNMNLNSMNWKW